MLNEKIPCLGLNRQAEKKRIRSHPWIFSNEIADPKYLRRLEPGTLVEVLDCHGDYVGTGLVNPRSLICVRILSRERSLEIDKKFFKQKLAQAIYMRETFYGAHTAARSTYRAVFGESDDLPGLVLDRYQSVWVLQPFSYGMYIRAPLISEALQELAVELWGERAVEAIVLRTDTRAADLEGIERECNTLFGELPVAGVWAEEGGARFPIDVLDGQKTGFFFDQRENRSIFCRWIKNTVEVQNTHKRKEIHVLDVYCHLGAWGLRALLSGASSATFVDQSEVALAAVRKAAKELQLEHRCHFYHGDAEKILKQFSAEQFQAVALDPPSFISSKKTMQNGLLAYRKMNSMAARLVQSGGVLSSSSCSYHCDELQFEYVLSKALIAAGRSAQILTKGMTALDHPALPAVAETRYLKNILLRMQ